MLEMIDSMPADAFVAMVVFVSLLVNWLVELANELFS